MISAYYILYNEQDAIIRSLESVKSVADEIIICIDNKTTDDTEKVVDEWVIKNDIPVYIYRFDWSGFADARNFAISQCSGDWILTIDADETVESLEIPDADFGICKVTNIVGDKKLSFDAIRLFKNLPQIQYKGIRQAIVDESLKGLKGARCNTLINHYGYDLTKEERKEKTLTNLEDHLKQFALEPDNLTVEYYIAHCYKHLGDPRSSIDFACLAMFKPINPELKATLCISNYLCYNDLGLPHLGFKWLMKSIEFEPMQILGRALLIQILDREGNKLLADEHYKIIQSIINNRNSKLPGDYYYSEAELNNLRSN